jgi:hypothetical protein
MTERCKDGVRETEVTVGGAPPVSTLDIILPQVMILCDSFLAVETVLGRV